MMARPLPIPPPATNMERALWVKAVLADPETAEVYFHAADSARYRVDEACPFDNPVAVERWAKMFALVRRKIEDDLAGIVSPPPARFATPSQSAPSQSTPSLSDGRRQDRLSSPTEGSGADLNAAPDPEAARAADVERIKRTNPYADLD